MNAISPKSQAHKVVLRQAMISQPQLKAYCNYGVCVLVPEAAKVIVIRINGCLDVITLEDSRVRSL